MSDINVAENVIVTEDVTEVAPPQKRRGRPVGSKNTPKVNAGVKVAPASVRKDDNGALEVAYSGDDNRPAVTLVYAASGSRYVALRPNYFSMSEFAAIAEFVATCPQAPEGQVDNKVAQEFCARLGITDIPTMATVWAYLTA